MIKIKVSLNGASKKINLSQFLGNEKNIYKNCRFYVNEKIKVADYWLILDEVNPDDNECYISPNNIFLMVAEVANSMGYYSYPRMQNHLLQFSKVFTCYETYRDNENYSLPYLPWMINANHGDSINAEHYRDYNYLSKLTSLDKTEQVSVICSNRAATEAHRQRIRFVESLKNHFKDRLEWFGNGINPLEQKWDGIAPYKYHIALENQSNNNVITEKLYDAFLGLSYPIYHGAPNVFDYFSNKSMTSINIKDLKSSITVIEELIESNTWEKSLKHIVESKNKCLNELNMYHRMAEICIGSKLDLNNTIKANVKLEPIFTPYQPRKFLYGLSNLITRAGNKGKKISMS